MVLNPAYRLSRAPRAAARSLPPAFPHNRQEPMMSDEYNPCPFCGSSYIEDTMRTGAIVCQNCGGSAPRKIEWNRRAPAPAVPDDVAMPALLASHVEWLRGDHEACNPWLADMIEAQAAELARLRSEAETTSAALSQAWVREAAAINQRDAALDACNQARLAFAGHVSQQSAVDKLDAALTHPTGGSND